MDVDQICRLEPKLAKYIDLFHDCFRDRKDTRAKFWSVYVRGQLLNLPEKSVEPIALDADVPARTLQEFLSQHRWDDDRLRRTGSINSSPLSIKVPISLGPSI